MYNRLIYIKEYNSPCGCLLLGDYNGMLCLCDWIVEKHHSLIKNRLMHRLCADLEYGTSETITRAELQLEEYFAGYRKSFDIPLFFVGSDFQKKVWNALLEIPYGTTVSYGEMAQRIGMPKSVRALANANGANSISIFAPCHRVIGSNGSLTGYGGGIEAKRFLLELESSYNIFK